MWKSRKLTNRTMKNKQGNSPDANASGLFCSNACPLFILLDKQEQRKKEMDSFYHAVLQLPDFVSNPLAKVTPRKAAAVTEIRLRSGRPVALSTADGICFVTTDGSLLPYPENAAVETTHAMLQNCFQAICGYSVHSFSACISNGFVPLPGGHRAGVCGTAFVDGNGQFALKNITSINLRVARMAFCHCGPQLLQLLHGADIGVIVAGAPGSGKTTLLRTVLKELSDVGKKAAVIDERFEIIPVERTGFHMEVPLHCDVLSGYPKHIGMQHALRALAPDVIVCDEIGTAEEIAAVFQAANAGVGLVVTIHAADMDTLQKRPQYVELLRTGAFHQVVFLKGRTMPGEIREVVDVKTDF